MSSAFVLNSIPLKDSNILKEYLIFKVYVLDNFFEISLNFNVMQDIKILNFKNEMLF